MDQKSDEDVERPTKVRKLSHQASTPPPAKVSKNSSSEGDSQEIIVSNDERSEDGDHGEPQESRPAEPAAGSENNAAKPLSKNQLKKIKKRQEWEAGRDYRKAKRKQKTKEKRERKKAANEERKANGEVEVFEHRKPRNPQVLPVTFILDCGFDDLMIEKEYISLGSQLTRAYSDNNRSQWQAHLAISSWGGKLKNRFDTVLSGHYKHWRGIHFLEEDFVAAAEKANTWMADPKVNKMGGAFEKYATTSSPAVSNGEQAQTPDPQAATSLDHTNTNANTHETALPTPAQPAPTPSTTNIHARTPTPPTTTTTTIIPDNIFHRTPSPIPSPEVIYLTADSPHTLTHLSPFSTYIIGGLVDKNRHKGICYRIAREKNIKTAKLPIGEFMEMQSRSVLATTHVVEIMLRWLECGDWGESFLRVIPKRKGGVLRGEGEGEGKDDGGVVGGGQGGEGGRRVDNDDEGVEREEGGEDSDQEVDFDVEAANQRACEDMGSEREEEGGESGQEVDSDVEAANQRACEDVY